MTPTPPTGSSLTPRAWRSLRLALGLWLLWLPLLGAAHFSLVRHGLPCDGLEHDAPGIRPTGAGNSHTPLTSPVISGTVSAGDPVGCHERGCPFGWRMKSDGLTRLAEPSVLGLVPDPVPNPVTAAERHAAVSPLVLAPKNSPPAA